MRTSNTAPPTARRYNGGRPLSRHTGCWLGTEPSPSPSMIAPAATLRMPLPLLVIAHAGRGSPGWKHGRDAARDLGTASQNALPATMAALSPPPLRARVIVRDGGDAPAAPAGHRPPDPPWRPLPLQPEQPPCLAVRRRGVDVYQHARVTKLHLARVGRVGAPHRPQSFTFFGDRA
jgi:hypothetical protein